MHHADVEGKVPQLETAHAIQMQVDALVHVWLHGSQSGLYFIGDLGRRGGELLRAEEAVDRSGYVFSSDVDVHLAQLHVDGRSSSTAGGPGIGTETSSCPRSRRGASILGTNTTQPLTEAPTSALFSGTTPVCRTSCGTTS